MGAVSFFFFFFFFVLRERDVILAPTEQTGIPHCTFLHLIPGLEAVSPNPIFFLSFSPSPPVTSAGFFLLFLCLYKITSTAFHYEILFSASCQRSRTAPTHTCTRTYMHMCRLGMGLIKAVCGKTGWMCRVVSRCAGLFSV